MMKKNHNRHNRPQVYHSLRNNTKPVISGMMGGRSLPSGTERRVGGGGQGGGGELGGTNLSISLFPDFFINVKES